MTSRWTHWAVAASLGFSALGAQAGAAAIPIPGDLSINGTVSLDLSNSVAATGGATQGGALWLTANGNASGAGFTGLSFDSGSSPLTGLFTQLNDGIGANFSMAGSASGDTTLGLFADLLLELSNTSATNTYLLTFAVSVSNTVTAVGADAFAYSEVEVRDATNQIAYFNDEQVDTVFPDQNYSGASAFNTFSISLAPGDVSSFSTLQQQQGGLYDSGSYSANLSSYIRLQSVVLTAVPEPATWGLMGLGLAVVGLAGRRRRAVAAVA